jgi:transposase
VSCSGRGEERRSRPGQFGIDAGDHAVHDRKAAERAVSRRLGARQELSVVTSAQTNRLRALLLGGADTERDLARATLTDPVLLAMARRREPPHASREQAVRHREIRRLAHAIRAGRHALAANRAQLQVIVDQIAPGLTERRGIGAVTAAQAIVSFSHPGRCRSDAAFAALSGTSPLQASSGKTVRHRLNRALNTSTTLTAQTPAAPAAA